MSFDKGSPDVNNALDDARPSTGVHWTMRPPAPDLPVGQSSIDVTRIGVDGSTKDMGAPPLDWPPPQPVEMDPLSNSRTLTSPQASVSASNEWDTLTQANPFGELSCGSSNHARPYLMHVLMDGPNRASLPAPMPLAQHHMGNDEPWFPEGISEILEDRSQLRHIDNRGQYKQHNPFQTGSFPYGALHSDLYAADVPKIDQDCQILQGHESNYMPPINFCLWPGCRSTQNFLTSNDLDFHFQTDHLRQCPWPTCHIQRSFHRRSDLLRHMESVHSGARRFSCDHLGCSKAYSRKDKLTAHKRSHLPRSRGRHLVPNDPSSGSPPNLNPLEAMNSPPMPSSDMALAFHSAYDYTSSMKPDSGAPDLTENLSSLTMMEQRMNFQV